jgi:hypothetical protein
MPLTIEQIVEETKLLPSDVVDELVDRILLAKFGADDPANEAALRRMAQRRLAELENGRVKGVPLEESLAKARAILGR